MTQQDSKTKNPASISRDFERRVVSEEPSFAPNPPPGKGLGDRQGESSGAIDQKSSVPEKPPEKSMDRRSMLKNLLPLAGEVTTKALRDWSLTIGRLGKK